MLHLGRRCTALGAVLTGILLVSGCGSTTADSGGPAATAVGLVDPPVTPSATAGIGPEFPVTIHREGGIAGFDDRVVLAADGRIEVTTLTVKDRVCTLAKSDHRVITLLGTVPTSPSEIPTTNGSASPGATDGADPARSGDDQDPDVIVITVTDSTGRVLDLHTPSQALVSSAVADLVGDVTLEHPVTRCTDPTP